MSDEQENQEQKQEAPAFATKEELQSMAGKFNEFTDTVVQYFEEDRKMKETNNTPAQPEQPTINQEDIEDLGFDERQVQFMNKLVSKVAQDVAVKTVTSYDTTKTVKTETQKLDNQAYSEFPELSDKNSILYKKTKEIMDQARQLDPNSDARPDFLLASALRAERAIKSSVTQQNFTNNNAKRQRFKGYHTEPTSMSSGGYNPQKSTEVTEERKFFQSVFKTGNKR